MIIIDPCDCPICEALREAAELDRKQNKTQADYDRLEHLYNVALGA
jgi:hypothetical protein